MSGPRALSQHPADRLIRELIAAGRDASEAEVARIIERMATARFSEEIRSVKPEERGISYQGVTLGRRVDSLTYHLIKRVVIERQWADGTTARQYVTELHTATREPGALLAVYDRRGGSLAATITPTANVLPPTRRGARPLPFLLVIYSADRGIIVTGYQFSTFAEANIPEEVRWLK